MATYFADKWHHDHVDEPVCMSHELDEARYDVRVVEDLRDGTRLRADQAHPDGETRLSEPLPPRDDIDGQAEFSVHPLTADGFEQVWRSAVYRKQVPLPQLTPRLRCSRDQARDGDPLAARRSSRAGAGGGQRLARVATTPARPVDLLSGLERGLRNAYRPDWNVQRSGAGYVTRFEVRRDFLDQYSVQQAGGKTILEYWIPAEDLQELNRNIVGLIEVVTGFSEQQ